MFTKKSDITLSNSQPAQISPYIRTMKSDLLSSGTVQSSPRMSEPAASFPDENPFSNESPTAVAPGAGSFQGVSIDSSSPFAQSHPVPETVPEPQAQPQQFPQTPISEPTPQYSTEEIFEDKLPPEPAAQPAAAPTSSAPYTASQRYSLKKVLLIAFSALIILLLLGGGYFFWMTRPPQPAQVTPPTTETIQAPQEPVNINPLSEKYTSDKPNYLPIDTNTASPDTIKQLLASTATDISQTSLTAPIEFIVTDTNNNPVTFHIFATLAQLSFPSSVYAGLDDSFSLYVFRDTNKSRIGLAVKMKDRVAVTAAMRAAENTLAATLSPILLDYSPSSIAPTFADGSYLSMATRYANLDAVNNLSMDYALTDNYLFIGTSKNTLRTIIDKNTAAQASAAATTPNQSSAPVATSNTATGTGSPSTPQQTVQPNTPSPAPVK
jgi:hypothetical protein